MASVTAAILCSIYGEAADSALLSRLTGLGIALFVGGLLRRWYAIVYLGRFFTVNVAIAADHRVIDTGPYKYLGHPSYGGALMISLGIGICLRNWLALSILFLPSTPAFKRRMDIQESALRAALGAAYLQYCRGTKRLIPFIY